jgi:hypothetical protein
LNHVSLFKAALSKSRAQKVAPRAGAFAVEIFYADPRSGSPTAVLGIAEFLITNFYQ